MFIMVMLAFAYATPKDLGFNPTVHKAPLQNEEDSQRWIYEYEFEHRNKPIPGSLDGTRPATARMSYGAHGVAGKLAAMKEYKTFLDETVPKVDGLQPQSLYDLAGTVIWLHNNRETGKLAQEAWALTQTKAPVLEEERWLLSKCQSIIMTSRILWRRWRAQWYRGVDDKWHI